MESVKKVRVTFSPLSVVSLCLSAGAALTPATARGQIFVANYGNCTIGEYNLDGTTVNAALVSGASTLNSKLNDPLGIAVSGSDLFVTTPGNGTIGEFTTSGATVSAPLAGGNWWGGIAVSGSDVFVASFDGGTIGEYTTSGATVNASLVSG
ncbi:MAG: hypothetical protein ABSH08_20945, partial [Tepidisphaeraceae bacterium]